MCLPTQKDELSPEGYIYMKRSDAYKTNLIMRQNVMSD